MILLGGALSLGIEPAHAQGTVTTPIGTGNDEAFAVAVQADGKIVVAGFAVMGGQDVFAAVRYDNEGTTLDTSFGGDGIVTTTIGTGARANALAIQPDGKIVLAGFGNLGLGGGNDVVVVRYNTDGTPDTSFDGDGIATTAIGAGAADDQGRAVAIYGDGQIVVGGYSHNGANYDFAAVRYNANGTRDTAGFGTPNGFVTFGFPAGLNDWGEAIGVQGNRIVLAGDTISGAQRNYGVVRFNANGSLDTAGFGAPNGYVTTDFFGADDNARFVLIQPDNRIVVAGSTDSGAGNFDFSLARYNFNGSLDATFNPGAALPPFAVGKVATAVGTGFDASYTVARQRGGALVVAGFSQTAGGIDFAVVRHNPDGTLDTTFNPAGAYPPGTPGKVTTDFGSSANDFGYGVAVEPDGRLIVAGSVHNGTNLDVGLARYCPNGNLLGPYPATSTFGYRRAITIDGTQVMGSQDLIDFPVLVDVTAAELRLAPAGRVEHAQGADIVFRAACGGTALDHEIELYDSGAGRLVAWVKVPRVQYDVDTIIYMYYGNASVTCSTQNVAGVWSAGYRGVWHLNEGSLGPFADATALANDGVLASNPTTPIAGQINGAFNFDTLADRHIEVLDDPELRLSTALTVSAWVTEATPDGQNRVILAKWGNNPGVDKNYWLGNLTGTTLSFAVNDVAVVSTPLAAIQGGAWHHVVGVADPASGLVRIYVDGTERNTAAYGGTSQTGSSPMHFANNPGSPFQYWAGGIDEGRVAFGARSAGWIDTEFRNQSSPGTFLSVGPELTCPCLTNFTCGRAYYSVGTDATDLKAGTPTLDISGGIATFSAAQPARVGVGDVVTYNGSTKAYISGRLGPTLYSVATRTGDIPADVTGATVNSISRAFNSLSAAQAGSSDASHLGKTDLVADGVQLYWACYNDSPMNDRVTISGWTTGPDNYVRVFTPAQSHLVGVSQRHTGKAGTGFRLAPVDATTQGYTIIDLQIPYARIEGIEIDGSGLTSATSLRGIGVLNGLPNVGDIRIDSSIIHDIHTTAGTVNFENTAAIFDFQDAAGEGPPLTITNNIIYGVTSTVFQDNHHISGIHIGSRTTSYVHNNTIFNIYNQGGGNPSGAARGLTVKAWPSSTGTATVVASNNYIGDVRADFDPVASCYQTQESSTLTQSYNVASDTTAAGTGSVDSMSLYGNYFVDAALIGGRTTASTDLHLLGTSAALWGSSGQDLSADFVHDIDATIRTVPWDIGADESDGTTAVKLLSFEARPADAAVHLAWRTGSELDNLGFHLYRSTGADGPWTRLTSALIPGLGSSAVGQAYSFRDLGLVNGTRYFYRLEDVDASSKTTSHGPVSAIPFAGAPGDGSDGDAGGDDTGRDKKKASSPTCPDWLLSAYASAAGADAVLGSLRCTRHGDPDAVSLGELRRDARSATLELRTGGFYALHEPSGTVRLFVPGFDFPQEEGAAALPIRRALAEAVVGRRVELAGVRAMDVVGFRGLVPSALGQAEMEVGFDGTVRAGRRGARRVEMRRGAARLAQDELVKLLPSQFQGEKKSAVVLISPLRYDERRRQLVLAKTVRLRLLFTGHEPGESGRGSRGRAPRTPRQPEVTGEVLARLFTTSRGLHAVSFEELFSGQRRGVSVSTLRLMRQGEAVAFHVEPDSGSFGPGGRLYFHADTAASSTDYSAEVAYELVSSREGVTMPLVPATPGSNPIASASSVTRTFETNRFYQPGLLEAQDLWLGEALASGVTRVQAFSLAGVDPAGSAALSVFLQGASESGNPVDHHLNVSLNGVLLGEARFAGKKPYHISLSVQASLLREGANELQLTNVADTGVASLVFLDRFALRHSQTASLTSGAFEGTWGESGTATVSGVAGALALLDVTPSGASPRWLSGWQAGAGTLRFSAEAGRHYLAVASEAVRAPRVAQPEPSTLRATTNRADYLLIAPRAFLAAAAPLVARRQDQGLVARGVAFEEIASSFGYGRPSVEAIREFLSYAFHSWQRPSPRYVLLLGDASYDPRKFIASSQPSPLPALWTKTSYLWTASDPLLAAVNGEDSLPDLAIGRLPATTVEQAEALVQKLLAWEDSGQGLAGRATLVADNPDLAGDFEADVEDIRASFLSGREAQVLKLSELGPAMRPRVLDALNSGLSYLSYVGHGGAAVWASENVWNSWDAASLQAQSQQPLLVTMNCLNGYFVAPAFDSLSESLLKAEGRGAVASFSPSGLSLDGPAHQYHRALMAELTRGRHERLGDAVLAAQQAYAESGLMPELISVYHLLGDPGTKIR